MMLDVATFEPSESPELISQVTVELEPTTTKGKINDVDAGIVIEMIHRCMIYE